MRAIDATQKLVVSNKGEIAFDKLVLALGADQIRVPLQGNAAHEVMTVNDLEEYAQFRNAICNKKKIAILGAGQHQESQFSFYCKLHFEIERTLQDHSQSLLHGQHCPAVERESDLHLAPRQVCQKQSHLY